ncbi:MAG: leucyl aminopeptidase [Alphaproteobacteria bacterium]|nr:leucyl aminopeptidase [Alphaproteobacteria bacterium]
MTQPFEIKYLKTQRKGGDAVLLTYSVENGLSSTGQKFDQTHGGFIAHALKHAQGWTGKVGEGLVLSLPPGYPYAQALIAGVGHSKALNGNAAQVAGGKIWPLLERSRAKHVVFLCDLPVMTAGPLLAGLRLRSYQFPKFKKPDAGPQLAMLDVVADKHTALAAADSAYTPEIRGVFFTRDLVNEPPNLIVPDMFAKQLRDTLKPLGVEIDIIDEKKMAKLGMGAILAVGQGSAHPPRLVVMRWNGAKGKKAPTLLVGKGVTFDTGGISIKPAAGMEEMKMDMGGAAAVAGAMMALALRKAKAHVVGIVALAENMPSGTAYRPADILHSLSGKTIEVLNTDAEGRLILADALTYGQRTYKPHTVIDLATLTGAMMMALGYEYCGAFVNQDKLWKDLNDAATASGEKLWRMPLDETWKKEMEGSITDLQNMGKNGRMAGACTAAGFLEHFIEDGTAWAHLDIAGTAWSKVDGALGPKHATGYGVRLLNRWVADTQE